MGRDGEAKGQPDESRRHFAWGARDEHEALQDRHARAGAEVQRPLATVVIGGIVSSTLLTLLVLPSIYGALLAAEEKRRSNTPPSHRGPGATPPTDPLPEAG